MLLIKIMFEINLVNYPMIKNLYHYLSIIIWLFCFYELILKFKFVVAICNKMNYLVWLNHSYMPIIIKHLIANWLWNLEMKTISFF